MSQKWRTVRIRGELVPHLEELVENAKDQYGIPLFDSVSDAVSQAVKELLNKHMPKKEVSR
jgi:Arc/MetJ-type ribon-helix-helix transcriptional regulator